VLLNGIGDLRRPNSVSGSGQSREFDACLNLYRSAKCGTKVFDGVSRVVLEQPDEMLDFDPDTIILQRKVVEGPRLRVTLWRRDLVEVVSVLQPKMSGSAG
jgi:hypothetical protein